MGLGGGWSRRSRLVSRRLGWGPRDSGKTSGRPFLHSQVRHYYFCKQEQQIFSGIVELALCRDSQAQGVTWEAPRKATSKPEIRPLLRKLLLAAG